MHMSVNSVPQKKKKEKKTQRGSVGTLCPTPP